MPAKPPRNERVQQAWRLGRWVGATLAAMLAPARKKEARPAEPAPPPAPSPELPTEEHRRLAPAEAGPPAHWVEKVRRAAPDLLLDLETQRRRRPPPGFAYPPVGLPRSAPAPAPAPAHAHAHAHARTHARTPHTPTPHPPAPPAVQESKDSYAPPAAPTTPRDPPPPARSKDPPPPARSKNPPPPVLPRDPPPPPVAEVPRDPYAATKVSEDSYTPTRTPAWATAEASTAAEVSEDSYSTPLAGALPLPSSPPPVSAARVFVTEPSRDPPRDPQRESPVLHLPPSLPGTWPTLGGNQGADLELDLDAPETTSAASLHHAPREPRWVTLPARATAASEPSTAAPSLPPPWPELPEAPATPSPHWSELYRALERRGRLDREQRGE